MTQEDARKLAWDHAWRSFQLHAGQRLSLFNFYIVAFVAGCAGYFSALQGKRFLTASLIAAVGIVLSAIFKMLDVRNNQLIKIAEKSLREQEEKINAALQDAHLLIFLKSEQKQIGALSFRQAFNIIFCAIGVSCVVAFGLALASRA